MYWPCIFVAYIKQDCSSIQTLLLATLGLVSLLSFKWHSTSLCWNWNVFLRLCGVTEMSFYLMCCGWNFSQCVSHRVRMPFVWLPCYWWQARDVTINNACETCQCLNGQMRCIPKTCPPCSYVSLKLPQVVLSYFHHAAQRYSEAGSPDNFFPMMLANHLFLVFWNTNR